MHNSTETPWPEDSPPIPRPYAAEKNYLTGAAIGAIFYGVVIVLFFRCMSALLHPVHYARENVRWGLVAYVAAAFSFATVSTATSLHMKSISYIDNREFPGGRGLPPGPYGYEALIGPTAIYVVINLMFFLNNWLAHGILLYRCCVIYAMNCWAIVIPSLMYLASLAMGIIFIYYHALQPTPSSGNPAAINFQYPYLVISLLLNILLTLMIVGRLILRSREIQKAMAPSAGATGLYKSVVTMLIESSALYAVSFLLFMIPWSAGSSISGIFFPILTETQVIAPFLIILRVANRRALTSDSTVLGSGNSMRFRSRGSIVDDMTLPDGYLLGSMGSDDETDEIGIVASD